MMSRWRTLYVPEPPLTQPSRHDCPSAMCCYPVTTGHIVKPHSLMMLGSLAIPVSPAVTEDLRCGVSLSLFSSFLIFRALGISNSNISCRPYNTYMLASQGSICVHLGGCGLGMLNGCPGGQLHLVRMTYYYTQCLDPVAGYFASLGRPPTGAAPWSEILGQKTKTSYILRTWYRKETDVSTPDASGLPQQMSIPRQPVTHEQACQGQMRHVRHSDMAVKTSISPFPIMNKNDTR